MDDKECDHTLGYISHGLGSEPRFLNASDVWKKIDSMEKDWNKCYNEEDCNIDTPFDFNQIMDEYVRVFKYCPECGKKLRPIMKRPYKNWEELISSP
jgi:hypothetical protein